MLTLHVEWLSERGGRQNNEDACGHWRSERQLCAVLADGAGGHGGGDIASRLAVREIVAAFAEQPTRGADELGALVRSVNGAMIDQRTPGTARQDMHSTVVCLVIDFVDGHVHWAHAGDSRLYWFRDGRLLQRTRDHSLVQSLVDAGLLETNRLRDHPLRSELRSALGVAQDVLEVDVVDGSHEAQRGDVFLLCTDGLWELVDDDTLERLLAQSTKPRAWLDLLGVEVSRATEKNDHHDNFTALTVWVQGSPDIQDPA
jgi:PPM family protein phosphatase